MIKKYSGIFKQIGFSYFTTFIFLVLNPLLIFLLTRTLSIKEWGIYAIISSTVGFLSVFFDLGMSQYIMSQMSSKKEDEQIKIFSTIFFSFILFVLLLIGIFLLTPLFDLALNLLKLGPYIHEFKIGILIVVCITLMRLILSYLTSKKRLVAHNMIQMIHQSSWIFALLALWLITQGFNLRTVLWFWLIGSVVALLISYLLLRKSYPRLLDISRVDMNVLPAIIFFSFPILFFTGGSWTMEIADRYIINYFLGSEPVAKYTLIYSLLGFIISISTIVSAVFLPYMAEKIHKISKEQTTMMIKYSLIIALPMLAGIGIMYEHIISMISGTGYIANTDLILSLLLYPLFAVLIQIQYTFMLIYKKTAKMALAYVFGGVLNIVLNILLVPTIGYVGAGLATTISYFVVLWILYRASSKYISIDYSLLKIGRIIFSLIAMVILLELVLIFFDPITAPMKILTILFCVVIYMCSLYMFGSFSDKEVLLFKSILMKKKSISSKK